MEYRDLINYIELTSQGLEKAAAIEQSRAELQTKIAAVIPRVVDALVENQRIFPDEREKAALHLQDPVNALLMLAHTAAHRVPGETPLGTAVKTAAPADALTELDKRFFDAMGV